MQTRTPLALLLGALVLLAAGSGSATPISMDPGSVRVKTILGVGNDFTLSFDGGDTSDNVLNFTVQGGGGFAYATEVPSFALAAIVFHGTTIIDSGDQVLGGVIMSGILVSDDGSIAAALLIDTLDPSAESFFLQLAHTPTTATIYSLGLSDSTEIGSVQDVLDHAIYSRDVSFSTGGSGGGAAPAIPEPSAALVFGVGLLFTSGAIRRRA